MLITDNPSEFELQIEEKPSWIPTVKRDYNGHTSQTNEAVKRISAFYFGNTQPAKERKKKECKEYSYRTALKIKR